MRRTLAAITMLVWGCGDEASIGSTNCTIANACQPLIIDTPLTLQTLSTSSLPTVESTWTDAGDIRFSLLSMASGSHGSLWLFLDDNGTLVRRRYDAAGTVVAEQRVSAPAGFTSSHVAVRSSHSHLLGPTVLADWQQLCPPMKDDGPLGRTIGCGKLELLVFGDDTNIAPSRIDATRFYSDDHGVNDVYRSQRGDSLYIPTVDDGLISIDLQGKVLWKSPLPRFVDEQDHVRLYGMSRPDESAGFDADGALLLDVTGFSVTDGWSTSFGGALLRQPADGGQSTLQIHNLPSSGPELATRVSYESHFVRDQRGRSLMAQQVDSGDLAVVRLDVSSATGFRLLREEYTDLGLRGSAMDPAGTWHVAFTGGGREPTEQRSMLCSFPLDGEPVCRNLTNGPGSMQAPAPGVIYIHGPGGFSRYDL